MGDIFREIDDELRQERFEKLWQRYGKFTIAAAVALVICVGGFKAFQHYQDKQRVIDSSKFATASKLLQGGKQIEAQALFSSLGKSGSRGYSILSQFKVASIKANKGDLIGAIKVYDQISANESLDKSLREAAVIFGVSRQLDSGQIDRPTLESKLNTLKVNKGAWRHAANALYGLIALEAGDLVVARDFFTKIVDDLEAPGNMRARATQVLAVMGK